MNEGETRLFVGIKISPKLQRELDNCPRETECYLKGDQPESLQIVALGGRLAEDAVHLYATSSLPLSLVRKEQTRCSA